jgi:predicted TPR repeat methyltransferase
LGASLDLAQLDVAVRIDAAPSAYVAALFDAYAPTFDQTLIERLAYSAPTLLAALARAAQPEATPHRFARALDLGCGTGLAGEALRRDIGYLEGVDIAEGMLAQAREKGAYETLVHADLFAHLLSSNEKFDLVLASDVFTYMGDLSRVMRAIAARLAPGGLLALAVEKGGPADWVVRESLRFAHSADYLKRVAADAGLAVAAMQEAILRKDRGADIEGLLALMKAPTGVNALASAARSADAEAAQTERAN